MLNPGESRGWLKSVKTISWECGGPCPGRSGCWSGRSRPLGPPPRCQSSGRCAPARRRVAPRSCGDGTAAFGHTAHTEWEIPPRDSALGSVPAWLPTRRRPPGRAAPRFSQSRHCWGAGHPQIDRHARGVHRSAVRVARLFVNGPRQAGHGERFAAC